MTTITIDPGKCPRSATDGIQEAIDALPEEGGAVLVTAGAYSLRRCLKLKSRVTLRGEGAATIISPGNKPVVRKLAKSVRPGDTHLVLEDTSGLNVGDQLCVVDSAMGGWNARYVVITEIKGKRVHGEIIYGRPEIEYSVERNALATNYFPGIYARNVDGDTDDVTIESLCLDGGEYGHEEKYAGGFVTAAIHTKNVNNLRVRDVTVRRWPSDGISVQGGTAIVSGCIVEDCLGIGMHPGTGIKESIWTGNIMRRNGSGYFFCLGCRNTVCTGNLMLNNKGPGIHGLCDPDRYNVVTGNVCAGNGEIGLDASGSFGNVISSNLLYDNSQKTPGVRPGIMLQAHENNVVTGNLCLDDRENPSQIRGIEALRPKGNNLIRNNYSSGGALIEERNVERENANLKAVIDAGTTAGGQISTPGRWGKPVFSDNFEAGTISNKWKPEGDHFEVVEGMLTGYQKISIVRKFTGRAVRLEYDVLVMSETDACDASMMAESPKDEFAVLLTIAGEYNRSSAIRINNEVAVSRAGPVLLRCRRQRVAVELGNRQIRVDVDGNPFLDYRGKMAPQKFRDLALSLFAWAPGIHFGNVKIYLIK